MPIKPIFTHQGVSTAVLTVLVAITTGSCGESDSATTDPRPATTRQAEPIIAKDETGKPDVATETALTAAGYGSIRIGRRADSAGYGLVDDGSYSDLCRIWRSDELPGVSVMVEDGVIRRVTLVSDEGRAIPIQTDRGVGLGSTETAVRAAYPVVGEQPHKYEPLPAKNLFFGEEGDPDTLRFEMGIDARVRLIHAGESPWVGYVESCS